MTERKLAVLFPGQGAFDGELLRQANQRHPQVGAVFAAIDPVAKEFFGRPISPILFGAEPVDLAQHDPWVSQLAIFGSDLAAHRVLVDQGLRPDVLVGHSLGEIAALVAANAFSVEDGARIVAHRVLAVQATGADGYLLALSTDGDRAQRIVDLIADPTLAVAVTNHDGQVVLSGATAVMDTVEAVARQLRIGTVRLNSPFPFHSPIMNPAVADFAARIRDLAQSPTDVPVYSPILRRYYEPTEAFAELLADHLVRPVAFAEALRRVQADGAQVFVEAGALAALTKLVGKVLSPSVTALATLARGTGDSLALDATLVALRADGLLPAESGNGLAEMLAPSADAETFAAFWSAHGQEIRSIVAEKLAAFTRPAPPKAAAAPVLDRSTLAAEIRGVYGTALEYPEEVFTDEVLLEAELGVDSVKQVELMTRVIDRYGIPRNADGVKLSDYDTMGKVIDFVHAAVAAG